MSDEIIFREVDEELRRDRLQTAWRRFGPYVIGACVAIILIVAANEGWSWWQNTNAARSSDQFYAALDAESSGDTAGAIKLLDAVIAQGSGEYPVLARFAEAGMLAKQGKKDDALKAYDDLANSVGNTRLKQLAFLSAANLLVDKGDVPGVKQRITGLLAADSTLRNSARETLGLAQYKSGDINGARDSFEAIINDPAASQETRGRIQVYIGQLLAEGVTLPAPADASAADVGAAAVSAASGGSAATSAAGPAASNGGEAAAGATTDNSGPAGVSASQPATPDAALQLAVPAAPGAPAAPPPDTQPMLSTGAGLPTPPPAAPIPDGAAPAAAGTTSAGPAAAPANDNATPSPATGTTGQ